MDGEISSSELKRMLEEGDPLVVDIRNPRQFARERVAGSVNIPLSQLPAEIDRVADSEHVVTVCPHGKASIRAARLVASSEEFDGSVESLADGLEGWGGPTESDSVRADASSTARTGSDSPEAPF
jgi:Rhodanese-related sulfurtransferase